MQIRNKEKTVYQGKQFKITQKIVRDNRGNDHVIEQCTRPDVVTVIGLNDEGKILLIKEFRPGSKKYVYWFPGGRIEKGEKPNDAAMREFREETSYTSEKLELFHKKFHSDSFNNQGYVYLASGLSKVDAVKRDEIGDIVVILVTIDEAINLALSGEIQNELFCFLIFKLKFSNIIFENYE